MSGSCRATNGRGPASAASSGLHHHWHAPDGSGAKVLVTGLLDGSFVGRLVLEDEAGILTIDKGRRYRPRTTVLVPAVAFLPDMTVSSRSSARLDSCVGRAGGDDGRSEPTTRSRQRLARSRRLWCGLCVRASHSVVHDITAGEGGQFTAEAAAPEAEREEPRHDGRDQLRCRAICVARATRTHRAATRACPSSAGGTSS